MTVRGRIALGTSGFAVFDPVTGRFQDVSHEDLEFDARTGAREDGGLRAAP